MKQRNSLNTEFWRDELAYIQSVNVRDPGPGYNNSPACFASYCDMQARSAERDGCYELSDQILAVAAAATGVRHD